MLLRIAEEVAWTNDCIGTAVITGEGVRGYYHRNGYHDEETFAVKNFKITNAEYNFIREMVILIGIVMLSVLLCCTSCLLC